MVNGTLLALALVQVCSFIGNALDLVVMVSDDGDICNRRCQRCPQRRVHEAKKGVQGKKPNNEGGRCQTYKCCDIHEGTRSPSAGDLARQDLHGADVS